MIKTTLSLIEIPWIGWSPSWSLLFREALLIITYAQSIYLALTCLFQPTARGDIPRTPNPTTRLSILLLLPCKFRWLMQAHVACVICIGFYSVSSPAFMMLIIRNWDDNDNANVNWSLPLNWLLLILWYLIINGCGVPDWNYDLFT